MNDHQKPLVPHHLWQLSGVTPALTDDGSLNLPWAAPWVPGHGRGLADDDLLCSPFQISCCTSGGIVPPGRGPGRICPGVLLELHLKSLSSSRPPRLSPLLSYEGFMCFMIRSMIHFELVFVKDVKSLFACGRPVLQHRLLIRLSSLRWSAFAPLLKAS